MWQDAWLPACHAAIHNWEDLADLARQEAMEMLPQAAMKLGLRDLAVEWEAHLQEGEREGEEHSQGYGEVLDALL